jgi:hypothetical protein
MRSRLLATAERNCNVLTLRLEDTERRCAQCEQELQLSRSEALASLRSGEQLDMEQQELRSAAAAAAEKVQALYQENLSLQRQLVESEQSRQRGQEQVLSCVREVKRMQDLMAPLRSSVVESAATTTLPTTATTAVLAQHSAKGEGVAAKIGAFPASDPSPATADYAHLELHYRVRAVLGVVQHVYCALSVHLFPPCLRTLCRRSSGDSRLVVIL